MQIDSSIINVDTPAQAAGSFVDDPKALSWYEIQTLPISDVARRLNADPEQIREHEKAGKRSDLINLPGTVALGNLRASVAQIRKQQTLVNPNAKPFSYPIQQVDLIGAVFTDYVNHPQILPRIKTAQGRYPCYATRSMISAVLMSVISLTDFDTFRIAFTSPNAKQNRFSDRGPLDMGQAPISMKVIARRVGFTHMRKGREVIDRKFRRAYDLVRRAGYIFSHQRKERTRSTFSGFDMAMRWVSPALLNDIRSALPYLVPETKWNELRKTAKKRSSKLRKLFSLRDLPKINSDNELVQKLRRRLGESGFTNEFLRELIVRFVHGSPGQPTWPPT